MITVTDFKLLRPRNYNSRWFSWIYYLFPSSSPLVFSGIPYTLLELSFLQHSPVSLYPHLHTNLPFPAPGSPITIWVVLDLSLSLLWVPLFLFYTSFDHLPSDLTFSLCPKLLVFLHNKWNFHATRVLSISGELGMREFCIWWSSFLRSSTFIIWTRF